MDQTYGQFHLSVRMSASRPDQAAVFIRKHRYEVGLPLHFDEEITDRVQEGAYLSA